MNIRVRLVVFAIIAASLLSVFALKDASAEDLSQEQIDRITANCVSIQGSLNQLHASDALLRVNRGQIYESIGSKLMGNFNGRLGNNGQDNKGLIVVADQYQVALAAFRTDYQIYERQLSDTMKIDCTKQPVAFHASLENARTKREVVHSDVTKLNQYIDDYRSAVNDFILNFERITGNN